ncbi:MAG: hypothetical protein HYU36_24295 [Planctomycetes bacterium]|nr:hypothetical protein [Planctomycetota bacterium]
MPSRISPGVMELVRTDSASPDGTFLVLGENEGKIIEIYRTYKTESMQSFHDVTGDDIVDMNPVGV